AVYYVSQVARPQYTSSVDLTINLRNTSVVDIESVVSGVSTDYYALRTELEIIRSRDVLGQVVDRLDLINDPEFNPALRTPSELDLFIEDLKARIGDVVTGFVSYIIPEGLPFGSDVVDPADESDAPAPATRDGMIGRLSGMVSASIRPETYVFMISVTTGSPETSKEIANTLADVYIQKQIEVKFEATEQAVTWLSERVSDLEQELKEREDALKDVLSETEMVNPEALEGLRLQAKDLRDRLQENQTRMEQTETRISRLTELRADERFDEIVEITGDQALDRFLRAIRNEDPDAVEMFDRRLETLLQMEQSDLERHRTQVGALQTSLARQEGRIERQSADLVGIQQMQREVEATRTLYETFLTRLKETSVQRGLQQADSRVLSDASAGGKVAPRSSRIVSLWVILGGMVGAGLVLIHNFMQNTFRTSEDLEAATGIMVMGQLPKMPIKARQDLITYLSDKPTSAAAEAIRNLRTSILLSNIDSPPQVIMTTSAVPGEGKTTVTIALAQNFSELGKRVLLIEGDIRQRTFRKYFNAERDAGLITALSEKSPFEEVVVHNSQLGADVLVAEKSRVNAADVFSSTRFRDLLKNLREIYDVIIIDTPPVLVVPDARVIGQYVDTTILAVGWDKTTRGQVTAALRDLASVNLDVSGLVLSRIDPKGMRQYGYGGYGGNYGAFSNYGKDYYGPSA
ncbi:MAG: polysaccharide biosynthesis tyrosine autokinase, partial [Loktanella sp.]|nr:polysaccharide biosynthesis tyrosine autokinase [Loktanella sp.]